MPEFVTSTPFLVIAGVVILILLIAFVSSRYHVAGANEALIVAGSRGAKVRDERGQVAAAPGDKGVKVVVGGGTFVRPLLDRVGKLKLTARQISVQLTDAVTSQASRSRCRASPRSRSGVTSNRFATRPSDSSTPSPSRSIRSSRMCW